MRARHPTGPPLHRLGSCVLLFGLIAAAPQASLSAVPVPGHGPSPPPKIHLYVDVHGGGPANAKSALRRHLRGCLAPDVGVAPLLVELRWSLVRRRAQVIVDVTWGAARLGARLLRGVQPDALIEAAAVATCVALDQALARPALKRRALRRPAVRPRRQARRGVDVPAAEVAPSAPRRGGVPTAQTASWRLSLSALGATARAPAPTGGVGAATVLRHGWWSGRLGVRALVPAQLAAGTGTVQSSTASAVLSACGHAGPVALCPLATIGLRFSSSSGLDRVATVRTLDGEVGARLWVGRANARGVGFALWLEATVPWVRTTLRANDAVAWRREGIALGLGLEVSWRPG